MKKAISIITLLSFMTVYIKANDNTYLNFTAANGSVSICLNCQGTPIDNVSLQYSTDSCTSWKDYTIGQVIHLSPNSKVFFKAKSSNLNFSSVGYRYTFQMSGTGKVYADGNIMSLLDSSLQQQNVPDYAFSDLFNGCKSLVTPPTLPATSLGIGCYASMFKGCESLTTAPVLPATTLAESSYNSMFRGCKSLVNAPALPATILAKNCYYMMFGSCIALTTPPALQATVMADYCYEYMFDSCSSLSSAPLLPAMTLAQGCYFTMFEACTSLTETPRLPAMTMADNCYGYMFRGCSSLKTVTKLPSMTLAKWCYTNMFSGCTSLTSIPDLPATTLSMGCYICMFVGCSSLKVNTEGPGTAWQIPAEATAADGWNTGMFAGTGGTFTGAPEIGVTYYIDETVPSSLNFIEEDSNFKLAPNPIKIGETISIMGDFTNEGMNGMTVEIIRTDGTPISKTTFLTSPIAIPGVDAAGTYIVRIMTEKGKVYTQKLIVN